MMQRVFPTSSDSPLLFVSGAKTAKAIIARLYYIHTYIHTYIYEMYNALYSREWLESEARAVARWLGLGRNGREVACF